MAGTSCSTALMLGLAEAIDRGPRRQPGHDRLTAGRAGVPRPGTWEFADTLLERC
jgi:hypothetical protein